jgi:TM2 domain-containing membrane protein YozV
MAGGQIFCDACQASWQAFQQPFAVPPPDGPNPTAAAVLGLIPGVGAMYNGQYFKALIHVVIFAVLVSMADHYGIFGIFIAAWVLYQSFEAFHTAKARRDGLPTPDPLGLNEVGNWLNLGAKPPYPGQQPGQQPGQPAQGQAQAAYQPPAAGQYQAPYQTPYQAPYQQAPFQDVPYQTPYAPPAAGYVDTGIPPVPPVPPSLYWRRKEPIGAIVLIALGVLFLLGQLDLFHGRMFEFTWPLLLICLGIWLVVRRLRESQGGSK